MTTLILSSWTKDRFAKAVLSTVILGAAVTALTEAPGAKRHTSMERHIRAMRGLADAKRGARDSQRPMLGSGLPDDDREDIDVLSDDHMLFMKKSQIIDSDSMLNMS